MRRLYGCLVAACLFAAAPARSADQSAASPVSLAYHIFFAGLDVADMHAQFTLSPDSYHVQTGFQLTGALGFMFKGHGESSSDGHFTAAGVQPRELFSRGQYGGKWHVTQIDYRDGQPVEMQLQPPVEKERDTVPPAEQAGSIDSLSAMAFLLHTVWTTGRCDGQVRTFDGRWLSRIEVHTAGNEVLPATDRSPFHGSALRCEIAGYQLAGFVHDADPETLRRPHRSTVWFAPLAPGGPVVPRPHRHRNQGFRGGYGLSGRRVLMTRVRPSCI